MIKMIFACTKILAYHSIHPTRLDTLALHPDEFYRQMKWLASLGWQGVSLAEYVRLTSQPNGESLKIFAVTFDDGYADNLKYALPVLKEFNFNATIFVVVDRIGTDIIHETKWLSLYPNVSRSDYRYLNWNEVNELLDAGMEIGAHTCTHVLLDEVNYQTRFAEIADCRTKLEQTIATPIVSFCYPKGQYNKQTLEIVKASGYNQAVVTPNKIKRFKQPDVYQLRRIGVYHNDNLFRFRLKCLPVFDMIRMLRSYHSILEL